MRIMLQYIFDPTDSSFLVSFLNFIVFLRQFRAGL